MADNPMQSGSSENTPPKIKLKSAEKKSDTARIDLSNAKPPPSIVDKANLPVDADDYFKRSTIRIDVPPAPGGTGKSDTARIEMPAAGHSLPPDDAFKSKTIPVGVPVNQPSPTRPKTIQMKRPTAAPGESIIVSPESTASATEQARKSETARIDLTAEELERPATRPKTIRIKRPDGTTGRKALTISRPEEGAGEPSAAVETAALAEASGDEEPGVFVGVMAIAALLVACALVYVLLAQTLAPTLPFPGRIL